MSDVEYSQEQHEMYLVNTQATGVEEWYCPTCGRRFLMQWPPNYEKVILEVGDEYAVHSGIKGDDNLGFNLSKSQVSPAGRPEEEKAMSDELRAALEDALKDIDFDDWPDEPGQDD